MEKKNKGINPIQKRSKVYLISSYYFLVGTLIHQCKISLTLINVHTRVEVVYKWGI